MGHNDYVRRDGQWSGYPVVSPTDMQRFDRLQFESWNGDDGGSANPLTPIILGGAGLVLSGTTAHLITGGVETRQGGRLVCGASTYPVFVSNQTRPILVPLTRIAQDNADSVELDVSLDPVGFKIAQVVTAPVQWTIPKRFLHHGGTLTAINLTFRVGQSHLNIPATRPSFTLQRAHQGHTAFDAVANGTLPAPGSATAYYSNGNAQTITGTVTGNAVIDVDQYTYVLSINDEASTNALAGNVYTTLALTFGSIADMRPE